jgi:predicted RNA-binding Zn-ribbon protein involved in translation (DUF1610 family)
MVICPNCEQETDKLHHLQAGQSCDGFPNKEVCWKCYIDIHVKEYEENYVCPTCGSAVKWDGTYESWANFKCSSGHVINVNFLELKSEIQKEQPKANSYDSADWTVSFKLEGEFWLLHNEKTGEDHPKHFDHKPTLEEIRELLGIKSEGADCEMSESALPCDSLADGQEPTAEMCQTCPDPCTDYCSHGVHKAQKDLDGECAVCQDRDCEEPDALLDVETGKVHEVVKDTSSSPEPSQQPPVQEGVPQGFYSNEYLISINKGFQPACEEGKYPKSMKCWKEGCDKPLEVCGYPFYICDNKHAFNIVTGERWLWKGYDQEYHGLLDVLQGKIEPMYQKLFYPTSRATVHTEADQVSTHASSVGEALYDLLNIQTDDPYHWGRDTHKHHAGIRFAINMMHTAITLSSKIEFPSEEDLPENAQGFKEIYEYDAEKYRGKYGDEYIGKMLTSVKEAEKELPKQTFNKPFSKQNP